jgi:hypothetical protein
MKTQNLTVAFFAVGSAIKFDKKKLLRSDGSSEYYALIRLLLKNKSVSRVLLLSKSDWGRLSETQRRQFDPDGKIYDPFLMLPELSKRQKPSNIDERRQYYIQFYEILEKNGISADFGLGFTSQGWSTTALPGFLNTLKPPYEPVQCLDMTLYYASEVIYYLNMTGLKWWLLATDPRYVKPSMRYRDIVNLPQKVLGQQDFDISWFGVKELKRDASIENDDYTIRNIVSRYSGIEKMNLMDGGVLNPAETDKPHKFTIVSMQLSAPTAKEDLRFNILKEYILDRDPDQQARIFGKWSDYFKEGYPQFKGYIATEDLDKTFAETRYTLVLPTAAGWVTSKYAEMLQLGVLPFLHPDYDNQYHIVPKDHPMRVKDADDFYKKMEYFDQNPEKRIKFIQSLQKELISNAHTGKFMVDLINKSFEESELSMKLSDNEDSLFKVKEKIIKEIKKQGLF